MRVQDPAKYAEVLLSIALPNDGYTAQRIRSMYGPAEQNINFPTPIPVHITYQTAFVDDAGKLQIRPDIYGIDAKTRNLISSERGVVEPAQERGPAVAQQRRQAKRARPKRAAAAARSASSSSCSVAATRRRRRGRQRGCRRTRIARQRTLVRRGRTLPTGVIHRRYAR